MHSNIKYYLKNEQECIVSFLNGFKIPDLGHLILGLIFRFGVILVYKIGRKV